VEPVERFTSRQVAATRIGKAIQNLQPAAGAQRRQVAPKKASARNKASRRAVAPYRFYGIDEHYEIFQNAPVYIANRGTTFVAIQRDPVAACFGHETATTIHALRSCGECLGNHQQAPYV
jgi:hypothetical protein